MFHGIDPAHVWHNPECARGHPATHEHEELKSAILRRAEMRKKLLWRIEIGSNYLFSCIIQNRLEYSWTFTNQPNKSGKM